jgi:hypothetical protein
MGRDEREDGSIFPDGQSCVVAVVGAVLVFAGVIICPCAGFFLLMLVLGTGHPDVGEVAVVRADASEECTVGDRALATVTDADFDDMRERLRAGDLAGVEAMERDGRVVRLNAGEEVKILRHEQWFEGVYGVRVMTGPRAGDKLFLSYGNVKKLHKNR